MLVSIAAQPSVVHIRRWLHAFSERSLVSTMYRAPPTSRPVARIGYTRFTTKTLRVSAGDQFAPHLSVLLVQEGREIEQSR